MADYNLSQNEANLLLQIEKYKMDDTAYDFPGLGGSIAVPIISHDKKHNFYLDISRSYINLSKGKYQKRARQVIVLARIDFGGAPHRNPDDQEIACPHLHIYREGYGTKWAFPIPTDKFTDSTDLWKTMLEFMQFCNITKQPNIISTLFT